MPTYRLYLESGPKHRKTLVHVLDLLGCVATGPTTDDAVAAAPEAIRAYLRFLRRHGASADPEAPIATEVAEHITEGQFLGNGSPTIVFGPDLQPLPDAELDALLERFGWLQDELGAWAAGRTDAELDAPAPGGGRTARAILLHVLAPVGPYLSAALGGAPGFSAVVSAAERGELSFPTAFDRITELAGARARAATPQERSAARRRPTGELRTLRKALRRMLEHDWEHFAELSRRPTGPPL
jgi:predicted RNase H-like HicB family nuclease